MNSRFSLGLWLLWLLVYLPAFGQHPAETFQMESLLNHYLAPYPFSQDNQIKLAAYGEMKGKYSSRYQSLVLDFGGLGKMTFYERNCLLRTAFNRVFHLDRFRHSRQEAQAMNLQLRALFAQIHLLNDRYAEQDKIAFIDRNLLRKNIEPLQKMLLRHILVHYGRYQAQRRAVEFHTDWLPSRLEVPLMDGQAFVMHRPEEPLKIKLDDQTLRGYYLWAGGTVYVEDVNRSVRFASGEEYAPNVTAFKTFTQKLIRPVPQFIAARRQAPRPRNNWGQTRGIPTQPVASAAPAQPISQRPQRYSAQEWVQRLLTQLRLHKIPIWDPEVLRYLRAQHFWPQLYARLTHEEQRKVDRIRY